MIIKTSVIAAVIFLSSGCSTTILDRLDYKTGVEIKKETMSEFKIGKTTKKDLVYLVGHPSRKEVIKSVDVWYYDFNKITVLNGNFNESTVFEWKNDLLVKSYKTGKTGKTGNALLDASNGL